MFLLWAEGKQVEYIQLIPETLLDGTNIAENDLINQQIRRRWKTFPEDHSSSYD